MMWRSVKIALRLTRSQQLEKAKAHWKEFGDHTEPELELPYEGDEVEGSSKYTVRRLVSQSDYQLEGDLQDNCINLQGSYDRAGDLYSIRDESNLPVVSMRMRRRTANDWSKSSSLTTFPTRDPQNHHTGNDVLVVDEAIQKGNAPVDKYIRPALSAMIEYARKYDIPKIAFHNGGHNVGSTHRLVDVDEVEKVLNREEEVPDYLYVSFIKGLRKPDGSLPTNAAFTQSSSYQPIYVGDKPVDFDGEMIDSLKAQNGDEYRHFSAAELYDHARVPFSKKRFERLGGISTDVAKLFGHAVSSRAVSGWALRDHVTELKPTVLNDIKEGQFPVQNEALEGKLYLQGSYGFSGVVGPTALALSTNEQKYASVKPDSVHPTTVMVPESLYYVRDKSLIPMPVVYGKELDTSQFDSNFKDPIYIATPSTLRDSSTLFSERGIDTSFIYDDNRKGFFTPDRANFVGSNKNDIWEIDTSKLPLDVLGRFKREYRRNRYAENVELAEKGVIPYEAISIASQSTLNKKKALPTIIRQCTACNEPWSDDHEGHSSALVNAGYRPLPTPAKYELSMRGTTLGADDIAAINRGLLPPVLNDVAHQRLSNLSSYSRSVTDDLYCSDSAAPHLSVDFNPRFFEENTRFIGADNYGDYAAGYGMPSSRAFRFISAVPAHDLSVSLHNWRAPEPAPEKFYFSVSAKDRRETNTYLEQGVNANQVTKFVPNAPGPDEVPDHDIWSIDTSHPDIANQVRYDVNSGNWTFLAPNAIPYTAMSLERRAEDAINPHIRQFFSKVAQYLTDGETSGGWVSEYWGQGGSVSAPTTADPSEVEIDPNTGKRKRPNGSLWTTMGDNGIDDGGWVKRLQADPRFRKIVDAWQGIKNMFSPNLVGINSYASVLTESLRQQREFTNWKTRQVHSCVPCANQIAEMAGLAIGGAMEVGSDKGSLHDMLTSATNPLGYLYQRIKGWKKVEANKGSITSNIVEDDAMAHFFIRVVEAASRRQERLKQREEALNWVNRLSPGYVPAAETVYELPNGFSVKKLNTYGDLGFEGHAMNHCLREDFASECEDCAGGGACSRCDGGEVECSECDGSGKEFCPNEECDLGEVNCPTCEGLGEVYDEEDTAKPCPDNCKGGVVNCETCKGEEEVQCSSCDGKAVEDCWECEGNGVCSMCNGEQEVQDANEPIDVDSLIRAEGQPYSLRNKDDVPVVTWWQNDGFANQVQSLSSIFGRQNETPKPEYQNMIIDYIHHHILGASNPMEEERFEYGDDAPKVTVNWGTTGSQMYDARNTRDILRKDIEKPDFLYFYHDHAPCYYNDGDKTTPTHPDGTWDCRTGSQFTDRVRPIDLDFIRRNLVNDVGPRFFKVKTSELPDNQMTYSPAQGNWVVNPSKISPDLFTWVRKPEDLQEPTQIKTPTETR